MQNDYHVLDQNLYTNRVSLNIYPKTSTSKFVRTRLEMILGFSTSVVLRSNKMWLKTEK